MKTWHIAVFVLALVIFGVANAPASLVAARQGAVAFDRAEGTIWRGEVHGLRLAGYQAETATWRIAFLDVVRGRMIAPVELSEGTIEGRVVWLGNIQGDRRIAANPLRLDGLHLGQMTLPGETVFQDVDILFERGVCVRTQGRIESTVLQRGGQDLGWEGPVLTGGPRCEGDDAVIELAGANSVGERVNARFLLKGDGAGAWRLSVQTTRAETIAALSAAGFSAGAGDGALGFGGEMRWQP